MFAYLKAGEDLDGLAVAEDGDGLLGHTAVYRVVVDDDGEVLVDEVVSQHVAALTRVLVEGPIEGHVVLASSQGGVACDQIKKRKWLINTVCKNQQGTSLVSIRIQMIIMIHNIKMAINTTYS